jgi:hypothetical protein
MAWFDTFNYSCIFVTKNYPEDGRITARNMLVKMLWNKKCLKSNVFVFGCLYVLLDSSDSSLNCLSNPAARVQDNRAVYPEI